MGLRFVLPVHFDKLNPFEAVLGSKMVGAIWGAAFLIELPLSDHDGNDRHRNLLDDCGQGFQESLSQLLA